MTAAKKKPSPAMVAKRRRSHLRQKRKEKGELSAEDAAELAELEAKAGKPGRPLGSATPEAEADDGQDEEEAEPEMPAAAGAEHVEPVPPPPPPIPDVPFPPAPPLARPPRVAAAPDPEEVGGKKAADWRDKWRAKAAGMGREGTVTFMAEQIITVLQGMADQCREVGVSPLIEPRDLEAVWVLTLDNVLPDRVKVTPEMHAAVGSSLIIGQRFFTRKKIAEHQKATAEKAKHDEFRRKQYARVNVPSEVAEVIPIRSEETVSEPAPVASQVIPSGPANPPEPATESTTPPRAAREFGRTHASIPLDTSDPTVVF